MAKLGNIFNKEEIKKEEQHPRRTIKWIHYSKLKTNPDQYLLQGKSFYPLLGQSFQPVSNIKLT